MFYLFLFFFLLDNISWIIYDVNMKDINKIVEDVKSILTRTDFMISWYAKKYNKTIFRPGNMNRVGCRTWEQNGDKYICFFDTLRDRYTTAINPVITYKRKVN